MAHLHLRHRVGAAVLVEEAEVRHEGARQREEDSELEGHRQRAGRGCVDIDIEVEFEGAFVVMIVGSIGTPHALLYWRGAETAD